MLDDDPGGFAGRAQQRAHLLGSLHADGEQETAGRHEEFVERIVDVHPGDLRVEITG